MQKLNYTSDLIPPKPELFLAMVKKRDGELGELKWYVKTDLGYYPINQVMFGPATPESYLEFFIAASFTAEPSFQPTEPYLPSPVTRLYDVGKDVHLKAISPVRPMDPDTIEEC